MTDNKEDFKNKEEPTLEELEETGKQIDEQRKYQDWLKENKAKLSDNRYILYRLPLSHDQREKVFQNLMKEEMKLREEEEKEKEKKI